MNNFFLFVSMIIMVHLILKKILNDYYEKYLDYGDFKEGENIESDFNEDYTIDAEDNDIDTDNDTDDEIDKKIQDLDSDDDDDLTEMEEQLRKRNTNNVEGTNGVFNNYREFNFGSDSMDLDGHVKSINDNDFNITLSNEHSINEKNSRDAMNGSSLFRNSNDDGIVGYSSLQSGYATPF